MSKFEAADFDNERWIESVGTAQVQWGVRWIHPVHLGMGEVWRDHKSQRDDIVKERRFQGYDVETAERTVNTTAWKASR